MNMQLLLYTIQIESESEYICVMKGRCIKIKSNKYNWDCETECIKLN